MTSTASQHLADLPMPEPSAALWAEFSRLTNLALRSPKDFDAEVKGTRLLLEAHRRNEEAFSLRGAAFDAAVALEREKFANWFESIVSVIRLQMAGRK